MLNSASVHSARSDTAEDAMLERAHAAIIDEEQELSDRVVAHLAASRGSRPPPPRTGDDQALLTLRDEVAIARLEDIPALLAQMEQVAAIASHRGHGTADPVDPKSPYFAHLKLEEVGRGRRDVLIGKTTLIAPERDIRIVDWRHAPISQLYYRYDEGAAYDEQFGEREVEGRVLARRTVTIIDGALQRISAPQGTFVRRGDGRWRGIAARQASLAGGQGIAIRAEHMRGVLGAAGAAGAEQREDRHLPEIAALLDPRQFEVISHADSGLVVVQGGAGSGKTTIGVHRMAYLAYRSQHGGGERGRFTADKMLVIVGTPALRDYIAQLLAALGLGDVKVATFARWCLELRGRAFAWLKVATDEDTPIEVARMKTDPALIQLFEERSKALIGEGRTTARDALWLWADVLSDRVAMRRALLGKNGTGRLTAAQLERALDHTCEACPAVVEWSPEESHLDGEGDELAGADGLAEEVDDRARLDAEDDALLLRCYQLVCGPLPGPPGAPRSHGSTRRVPLVVEHLFVDEAQDLAAVDVCVLAAVVTEQKSITLAGDMAQRLHLDTGFASWDEVLAALQLEHTAVEPLKIAYRCTREVLQFAREVLGPLADPDEPHAPRSGAPIELYQFPTTGAAAAFLGDALRPLFVREPRATIALLARYPEQADAFYDALKVAEVPNLRRVRDYDFAFRPGVDVTEVRQVKGLEYDYVILVDVNASSYPENDEARYQLHIGATRAAHQLWVLTSGTPSRLLPARLLDDAN
ncbi:MAG: DNA helicase UvrD [Myxococcales bacterium]|nr:DNA helicase UvrD [Myxococcales bacterium]